MRSKRNGEGRVASGSKSSGRNVGRYKSRSGEFFRERNRDAAGARADIRDAQSSSVGFLSTTRAKFAEREAVKRNFYDMLGFGARDQNIWRNLEFQAPEFLLASEVLS